MTSSYRPVRQHSAPTAAPTAPSAPARPALSYAPAPVSAPPIVNRPSVVTLGVALLHVSFLCGLLAVANQLAHREELFQRLLPRIADAEPEATNLTNQGNTYAVLTLFAMLTTLLILLQLWMSMLVWRRRGSARYLLIAVSAVAVLTALANLVLIAAGGPHYKDLDSLLLEASVLLTIGGCVPLFSAAAQEWFQAATARRPRNLS